jgi:type VI secretion system secreted protein VgrG
MPTYTQGERPLSVKTPLGKDALLLVAFEGREAISELFHFHLDLLAENRTPIAFDRVVGQTVTVTLTAPGGGKRHFHGLVNRFGQGKRDETFTRFRADIVPRFWLWTKRVQSRIFQHVTVPGILKQVLAGLNVKFELRAAYQPRDYCVQYRESDFAFASRLMEEEGIFYYFAHTDGDHQMVVTDVAHSYPAVAGTGPVVYREDVHDQTGVSEWDKTQELRSGKYTLWDHCFEMPGKNLEAQAVILDTVTAGTVTHRFKVGGNESLEVYDYPGGYAQRFDGVDKGGSPQPAELSKIFDDGGRTARVRMEQEALPGLEVRGASNCGQFVPGHQFTLSRHFDANGPYLLTRVEHTVRTGNAYRSGGAEGVEYRNEFTCVPVGLPYRPRRVTPRPTLPGTQTATVVGPGGQEAFLDKYGRVKVCFHWDRQCKKDADSSCWVRVAQTWAGKGWGAFFWPRAGHEVVVAFEEGDPDRPLIVGSVYNAENMPPYALPHDRLVNGIKSCSGDGRPHKNFNALIFYDKPGDEHTQVHSEKHYLSTDETSHHTHVGDLHARIVGGLPFLGSGSGGGDDDKEQRAAGTYKLHDSHDTFFGGLALDLSLTCGESFDAKVGLSYEETIGGKTEFYFDPLCWLDWSSPGTSNCFTGIMAGAAALLGKTEVKLCTETSLLYGTQINITRGNTLQYQGTDIHGDPLASGLAMVTAVYPLAQLILFSALKDGTLAARDKAWFLYSVPWQVAEALLVGYERNQTVLRIVKDMVLHSTNLVDQFTPLALPLDPPRKFAEHGFKAAMDKVQRQLQLQGVVVKDATGAEKGGPDETMGNSDFQVIENCWTRFAADICLVSRWQSDKQVQDGFGILLDAQGKGPGKADGNLWLNATGSAQITCDTACVALRKKDKQEILVECDKTGEITLHQASVLHPKQTFTPEGITLSLGQPPELVVDKNKVEIKMTKDEIHLTVLGDTSLVRSFIRVNTDGIVLSANQGCCTIELDDNGITLTTPGNNSIKISDSGIVCTARDSTLNLAETLATLSGQNVNVTQKGGVVQIQ